MSEEITKLKKDQRKQSIIETALKIMAENGLEATSMRSIAKAEGISETLLYRYYSNKFELFASILKSEAEKIIVSLSEVLEMVDGMIPDPRVTLLIMWKMNRKRIFENKQIMLLIMKERKNFPEIIKNNEMQEAFKAINFKPRNLIESLMKMPFLDKLALYFKRCQEAGNLRKELDPKMCAQLFLQLVSMPIAGGPFTGGFVTGNLIEDHDEYFDTQIDILLNGILPKNGK
ncbi:MAG: TetR/AcrR family transcriptional regulator [Asgard group archaeon]|nr:TetR/AcrR family transcriptional regulator [Asgard group archaeon]